MRDSQRSKVYRAESVLPTGKRLSTVAEMQAWFDDLAATDWFRHRWGIRSITVKDGRGHVRATGGFGNVHMPKWSRTESVLIHEIAHNLTERGEHHGPNFARVNLALIEYVFGATVATTLRVSYRKERVKVGPPIPLLAVVPPKLPPRPVDRFWRITITRRQPAEVRTVGVEAHSAVQAIRIALELLAAVGPAARVTGIEVHLGRRTTPKRKSERVLLHA